MAQTTLSSGGKRVLPFVKGSASARLLIASIFSASVRKLMRVVTPTVVPVAMIALAVIGFRIAWMPILTSLVPPVSIIERVNISLALWPVTSTRCFP